MRNVKVAMWGFGAMGSGIASVLAKKIGLEITGACDRNPELIGKSVYDIAGTNRGDKPDALVISEISELIFKGSCDICVITTNSTAKDVFPKIKYCVERGINVITTAEEMSYPKAQSPDLAEEIDRLARENGVTVFGTGVNPGMMMDLLAICITGVMTEVEKVSCKRVNSLSPFGPIVMREQGIGLSVEEFSRLTQEGKLTGHVGFAESTGVMAEAIGWKLEKFEQQMLPIITDVDRKSPYGFAPAGSVAGVNMTGQAWADGKIRIDMYHPQQIEPEMAGVSTGDYVTIDGNPSVHLSNVPEVEGGIGTIAMCVNMLPFVVAAAPGLKTMLDMPVPRCVMGSFNEIAFKNEA